MTTRELYRKHKAGEVGRDRFLYEVRRDKNLPWVTNITSYDDAVKILKNKGIISEVDANVATDPAVDRVNPYFLKKGVQMMLSKEEELTNDSYIKALNKAAKQLQKNPHAFDKEMFANTEDVDKADATLETEEVKKNNHVDKDRQMKKVKVKALKEAALQALTDSLKKKESINEDSHWHHHVGSEVHTPDGKGKVTEIVGGTLTVELEDGTQKDYQINTIDHHTQKAQDSQADAEKAERDQMWKNFDQLKGVDPETGVQKGLSIGQQLNYKPEDIHTLLAKLKEYISKNKGDKEKIGKLKEAVKKLKEFTTAKTRDAVHNAQVIRQIDTEVPNPQAKAALKTSFNKGNPIDL
jgi:hypothetical protein